MSCSTSTFRLVSIATCAKHRAILINVPISYHEEGYTHYLHDFSADFRGPHIVGACTGLIAASAIASAKSLTALLPLAVEAVRIAFRTGLYVGDVAERLEGSHDACKSWSTVVATSEKSAAEEAINKFNEVHVCLPSKK